MMNLWQNCASCSEASRIATVKTKILSNQGCSGSPLDSLDILFNADTYYSGLHAADPSNITPLEVLGYLLSRICFKGRYETICRFQV